VVALVDNRGLLVLLREVIAIEAFVTALPGVRDVDVGELTVRALLDIAAVVLYPRAGSQALLVADRDDSHLARAGAIGTGVHGQHCLSIGRAVEQTIDVVGRNEIDAVDREDEVANRRVDAWSGQRRTQFRVPALAVIDAGDLVAAAFDGEVGAEQPAA